MSDQSNKIKKSKRIQRTTNAIQKQLKIAKSFGHSRYLKEPHRLAKQHAMDCGNPKCLVCHSEKVFNRPTLQERRLVESLKKDSQNDNNIEE
jgi:hypothetical protein